VAPLRGAWVVRWEAKFAWQNMSYYWYQVPYQVPTDRLL
jgi:hypothetical protein